MYGRNNCVLNLVTLKQHINCLENRLHIEVVIHTYIRIYMCMGISLVKLVNILQCYILREPQTRMKFTS